MLIKGKRDLLFRYISGLLENKKCHLYRINGVEDHIHIVTHIHPTVALSGLVKDIKLASSNFIKEQKLFLSFDGWQEGFGAFTYSIKEKDTLIRYVMNQETHHAKKDFMTEYKELLIANNIEFNERYLL